MSNKIDLDRRRLLGAAAATFAAAQLGMTACAKAQSNGISPNDVPNIKPDTNTSFGPLKQINAGLLNIGYADLGPANGPVVMCLHGWPYDILSYVDVAPALASLGYRVIVPYLRGYGTTTFLSNATLRNGQQAVVALDIIALMDALKIDKAIFAGFDWGGRTSCIIAALHPERCKALVSVNGYTINNIERNKHPSPPAFEHGQWYQFYFATDRGKEGYDQNRHDFNKIIWNTNSPKSPLDDAAYERTAPAFQNADHVAVVIHNYRFRLGLVTGEPQYADIEKRLAQSPVITVPTITVDGDSDGIVPVTDGSSYAKYFTGKWKHTVIKGAGHNVPQETPREFAQAIVEVDGF